jgi:hypothetical protein
LRQLAASDAYEHDGRCNGCDWLFDIRGLFTTHITRRFSEGPLLAVPIGVRNKAIPLYQIVSSEDENEVLPRSPWG